MVAAFSSTWTKFNPGQSFKEAKPVSHRFCCLLSQPRIGTIWLIVDCPPPTTHCNHIDYVDLKKVNQVSHDSDDNVLLQRATQNVEWIKSYKIV
jgi:hypothetical protein